MPRLASSGIRFARRYESETGIHPKNTLCRPADAAAEIA